MMKEQNGPQAPERRNMLIGAVAVVVIVIVAAIAMITTEPETGADGGAGDIPPIALAEDREWQVTMRTSQGDLTFTLDGVNAPQATASFIHLAGENFFDGTECHRLLPGSLLQCGDPTASGAGGPGYSFGPVENAPEGDVYAAGTVAMARIGGNGYSMGSQFFLVFDDVLLPSDNAGGYSVMGTIDGGLELLQDIGRAGTVDGSMDGRPLTSVIIESVEVA